MGRPVKCSSVYFGIPSAKKTRLRRCQTFSCSTQLSMEFQLPIKAKMRKINQYFFFFKLLDVAPIMLINVKMPTIDGILTFMSMLNFMLSYMEHKRCINSGLGEV